MDEFLSSMDFMRLGQAVNHENWQSAMMIIKRMSSAAEEIGAEDFERMLSKIRVCVQSKSRSQALNALAMLTALRVRKLKEIKEA